MHVKKDQLKFILSFGSESEQIFQWNFEPKFPYDFSK